jgi:capsular exopolysaccharide synthesis family protein
MVAWELRKEANVAESPRLAELRRRLGREPDPRLFAQLADELRRNGEVAEAIDVARQGIGRYPDNPGARISLGRALLDSGDAESARKEFETVLRDAPENVLAHRLLGQCLETLGDAGSALAHYRAALAQQPADEHSVPPVRWPSQPRFRIGSSPAEERQGAPLAGSELPLSPLVPDRLSLRADEGRPGEPDAGGAGRDEDSLYVDFSDEGTVRPAKVSPIMESLTNADSVVGEALRLLGARVQKLREDRKMGCVAVTSPLPGDGKSAVALGLAGALAREGGRRVLLVEADLRRPSLTSTLGLPPSPGLTEWLKGGLEYVPLRLVEPGGFFLLVAGQVGLEQPELLGSPRMDALLRAARRLFDMVLLDAVPVMPVTDTVLIQELIDGFLLVVRSRQTPRDALQEALTRLRSDKILGVVLNDHEEYRDSYRSYAYGRYGMVERSRRARDGRARRAARRKGQG